jgi:hypothetical protein
MGNRTKALLAFAVLAGISLSQAPGQETSSVATGVDLTVYDVKREVTLSGTVQDFIPYAQTAPLGAHVKLQTSAGIVDVHLGDARFLAANQFGIWTGDTLRTIGEPVAYRGSTQFVARIVQKGTRALAVRSVRGIPLLYMAPRQETPTRADGVGP